MIAPRPHPRLYHWADPQTLISAALYAACDWSDMWGVGRGVAFAGFSVHLLLTLEFIQIGNTVRSRVYLA